jgi:ribonuclease P protein component
MVVRIADRTRPQEGSAVREQRIRHRIDFLRVQKTNVRVTSRHFVFLLATSPRSDLGRMGITVSRRIGTAVVRNRARRLVREAARRVPELVPAGIDLVLVWRAPPERMRMQDALAEFQEVAPLIGRRSRALMVKAAGRREDKP